MKSGSRLWIVLAITMAALIILPGCDDETTCNISEDQSVPTITVTYPQDDTIFLPDTLLSDAVTILTEVENGSNLKLVQFYIDDEVIAYDYSEPYEQIWYAPFWARVTEYILRVKAIDYSNNEIWSNEVRVTTSSKTEYNATPELVSPDDGMSYSREPHEILIKWNPVPGAKGYLVQMRDDQECNCQNGCGCINHTDSTQVTAYHNGEPFGPIRWRVQAYWSMDHTSKWSEERSFSCE